MLVFWVALPKLTIRHVSARMAQIWREVTQRLQDVGVFRDFRARQRDWCVTDQLAVEKNVNVNGARAEFRPVAMATEPVFYAV